MTNRTNFTRRNCFLDRTGIDPVQKTKIKPEISKEQIINEAFEFISKFEGCHLQAYWDYKHYSIGYGSNSYYGEVITEEEAEKRAKEKIKNIIDNHNFREYANKGLIIALTSFTYNLGYPPSGYQRYIDNGYYEALKNRFKEYVYAGGQKLQGLIKRRNAETNLF